MKMKTSPSKKSKTQFFCQSCGHQSPKWLGRCPSCGEWNQFVEEEVRLSPSTAAAELKFDGAPLPIDDISATEGERALTGIAEMDRVLGGGIVGGSAILVGGDPGIGKSTLLAENQRRRLFGNHLSRIPPDKFIPVRNQDRIHINAMFQIVIPAEANTFGAR
ncbi:MAG: hypothetical protein HY742_09160 [Deltaproteobacteria bacterium]|nr:hypothetical protein [Deltaproteobacteria bacterium]